MEDIGENWLNIFTRFNKESGKSIEEIMDKIDEERKLFRHQLEVYPPREKIFNCFKTTEYEEIKVVILGQDPYHGKDQATGLAFGVNAQHKTPPSLNNIEKELISDVGLTIKDKTLVSWVEQGVIMLNTSLSVVETKPGSHIKYWQDFTQFIIDEINNLENVIFVAWGAHAYSRLKNIDRGKHSIIVSSHPSPLSCNKKFGEYPPFLGSKPFSRINTILHENNKSEIKW
mgnify:CR=1 FL=1